MKTNKPEGENTARGGVFFFFLFFLGVIESPPREEIAILPGFGDMFFIGGEEGLGILVYSSLRVL